MDLFFLDGQDRGDQRRIYEHDNALHAANVVPRCHQAWIIDDFLFFMIVSMCPGRRLLAFLAFLALNYGSYFVVLHCQSVLPPPERLINPAKPQFLDVCAEPTVPRPLREALQLVCLRSRDQAATVPVDHAIVIGFVGGFVSQDDAKHPEVLFAAYLRHRYPSAIHAEVFSNHQGKQALRRVLSFLDLDHDGGLSASEKQRAKIIIYGHSWGASQAVKLARELDREGIPVLLTIQVDSIRKLGQNDSRIPANVEAAVNFYQTRGPLHGRAKIIPDDPARTRTSNFEMTYEHRRINCSNYHWLVRVLNRPHLQIENDPRVWDQIAALIESELSPTRNAFQPGRSLLPLVMPEVRSLRPGGKDQ